MSHHLTSTAACKTADAMALKRAKLGKDAHVVSIERRALDSYDLAYLVASPCGKQKSVVVTNSEVRARMLAEKNIES